METEEMGRVVVAAEIANSSDFENAHFGRIEESKVRRLDVVDALVDTGATYLSLPKPMIERLGLREVVRKRVRTAGGDQTAGLFSSVRLFVNGRDCVTDVMELPAGSPVLIGQIPLEAMDWVVDPKRQRLIGNPEHDGEWVFEAW